MTGTSDHKNGQSMTKLRTQAAALVTMTPTDVSDMPAEEIERLLYELEIHREELQIQQQFPDGLLPRGVWGSERSEEGLTWTMGPVRLALS
ncbi:MAG: hypothetical protein ACI8P0_005643, partial [Planctomycetaceae bacterium]